MPDVLHKAGPVEEGVKLVVDVGEIQPDQLNTHICIPNTWAND